MAEERLKGVKLDIIAQGISVTTKIERTDELTTEICERLIDGQSLRTICLDEHMPSAALVCKWLGEDATFREQYARAREAQADTLADEILDIADDATNDWMERKDEEDQSQGWILNGEHVQRSRLRVDSRKWYASKLAPKRYGDKVALTGDEGGPLQVTVVNYAKPDPSA